MRKDWQKVCNDFLEATSYTKSDEQDMRARYYDRENKPETYLKYKDAQTIIPLGEPAFPEDKGNLWKVLKERRSKRNFINEPITLNELNLLLWGTQGITADLGDYQLRTTPSAGALYPIETYLLVNNVVGLEQGLYHLNVRDWSLEALKLEEVSEVSYQVTHNQDQAKAAAVNFVWTAVIERTRAKYHERAYRYIWWDSGHVAQNLHLVGNQLGLGVCTLGHWLDKELHEYLGIDGKEHVSALFASVGRVEGKDWLQDRRYPKPKKVD